MRSKIRAVLTVVAAVMMLCACGTDDTTTVSSVEQSSRSADQACDSNGNCGNPCTQIEPCGDGYAWDSRSCACRPRRGGPPTSCGPSLTCRGTELCCAGGDPTLPTYFCTSGGVCPL